LSSDKNRISKKEVEFGTYYAHSQRPKHAREVDESLSANLTNNPFLWLEDFSRHDFPLIDTIARQKPKGYTKSRGKNAYSELMEFYNV